MLFKKRLSSYSIKQALDNLDVGLLFADSRGRVLLFNHLMSHLCSTLIGSYPQMLFELEEALASPKEDTGVIRLLDDPSLYQFSDGRVFRFSTVPLSTTSNASSLYGYTQTTAEDVTKLYRANLDLKTENLTLARANQQMMQMLEKMEDHIREQETLHLKVKIHNDIGASLIALSSLSDRELSDNQSKALSTLQFAVRCFTGSPIIKPPSEKEVFAQAKELGISIVAHDDLVDDALLWATIQECLTNCHRHAKGHQLFVKITKSPDQYKAVITNDGTPPQGPITEGSGLTSLRISAEKKGGQIIITHSPQFTLTLSAPFPQ